MATSGLEVHSRAVRCSLSFSSMPERDIEAHDIGSAGDRSENRVYPRQCKTDPVTGFHVGVLSKCR